MSRHHERFVAWLEDGAPGEPARDLAVHANGCDACLQRIRALDQLAAADIGAIHPPEMMFPQPSEVVGEPRRQLIAAGTTLGTALVVLGLVMVALLGRENGLGFVLPTPVPSEGTLAGNPGGGGTSEPPSSGATGTASASAEAGVGATDEASSPPLTADGTGGTLVPPPAAGHSSGTGGPTQPWTGYVPPAPGPPGATAAPINPSAPTPLPTVAPTRPPIVGPPPPPPPTPAPTVAPPPPPPPTAAPTPTPPPPPPPTAEPTPEPTPEPTIDLCIIDPLDPICDPILGRLGS